MIRDELEAVSTGLTESMVAVGKSFKAAPVLPDVALSRALIVARTHMMTLEEALNASSAGLATAHLKARLEGGGGGGSSSGRKTSPSSSATSSTVGSQGSLGLPRAAMRGGRSASAWTPPTSTGSGVASRISMFESGGDAGNGSAGANRSRAATAGSGGGGGNVGSNNNNSSNNNSKVFIPRSSGASPRPLQRSTEVWRPIGSSTTTSPGGASATALSPSQIEALRVTVQTVVREAEAALAARGQQGAVLPVMLSLIASVKELHATIKDRYAAAGGQLLDLTTNLAMAVKAAEVFPSIQVSDKVTAIKGVAERIDAILNRD